MELHSKLHSLTLEFLRSLKNKPEDEIKKQLGMIDSIMKDMFFFATGIESWQLDYATDKLKLEENLEFQLMEQKYKQGVQEIQLF